MRKLLISLTVAATMVIANCWKSTNPPSTHNWVIGLMSKITTIMDYQVGQKETLDDYQKVWEHFWRAPNVGESNASVRDILLSIL